MCESPDKTVKRAANDIGTAINDTGKNIERNVQNIGSGVALMASGDFNNAGRTLLDAVLLSTTGGMINPDDVNRATNSVPAMERKVTEATKKSEQDAADVVDATKVAEATALTDQVKSLLRGVTESQRRTPGRAVSLLGNKTNRSTLLG